MRMSKKKKPHAQMHQVRWHSTRISNISFYLTELQHHLFHSLDIRFYWTTNMNVPAVSLLSDVHLLHWLQYDLDLFFVYCDFLVE